MVGNLEGVITDQPQRPFLLKHTPKIFNVLEQIKPLPKWTLTVANNHAMDYGDEALDGTINKLEKRDIKWLGTVSSPTVEIADKITATAWSWWMNGSTNRIHSSNPGSPESDGLHIALPHWGYEHERTPRQNQRHNIPENYDMIVGHHSHLPQPLELVDDRLPVAWSLGNFLTAKTLKVLGEGAVMKVVVNRPDNSNPTVQSVDYRTILLNRDNHDECRVSFR
jgi:poly-gamma-glutamate capsule biosynthesis protein CapA/YwtB (metallophosphatase superfamily)